MASECEPEGLRIFSAPSVAFGDSFLAARSVTVRFRQPAGLPFTPAPPLRYPTQGSRRLPCLPCVTPLPQAKAGGGTKCRRGSQVACRSTTPHRLRRSSPYAGEPFFAGADAPLASPSGGGGERMRAGRGATASLCPPCQRGLSKGGGAVGDGGIPARNKRIRPLTGFAGAFSRPARSRCGSGSPPGKPFTAAGAPQGGSGVVQTAQNQAAAFRQIADFFVSAKMRRFFSSFFVASCVYIYRRSLGEPIPCGIPIQRRETYEKAQ